MLEDTRKLSWFSYVVKILTFCCTVENIFGTCADSIVCSIKCKFFFLGNVIAVVYAKPISRKGTVYNTTKYI